MENYCEQKSLCINSGREVGGAREHCRIRRENGEGRGGGSPESNQWHKFTGVSTSFSSPNSRHNLCLKISDTGVVGAFAKRMRVGCGSSPNEDSWTQTRAFPFQPPNRRNLLRPHHNSEAVHQTQQWATNFQKLPSLDDAGSRLTSLMCDAELQINHEENGCKRMASCSGAVQTFLKAPQRREGRDCLATPSYQSASPFLPPSSLRLAAQMFYFLEGAFQAI